MKLEPKHMTIIVEALGTYGKGIVDGIIELERRAITAEQQLGQERNKNIELSKKVCGGKEEPVPVTANEQSQPTQATVSKKGGK